MNQHPPIRRPGWRFAAFGSYPQAYVLGTDGKLWNNSWNATAGTGPASKSVIHKAVAGVL